MLCVMAGKVLHSSLTTPFLGNITHHMASEDHGWNLILVNRENYIPADYEVQLTELSNGKKVDSRIYPELQEMFNAARAQGYGLFVREGYRTQEEQQQLMNEKIEAYDWLEENAHTYGFIKRYPSNKTDITGVINEPWHYRYVGKEAASAIYSQGICLEEYIETLE